MSPQDKSQYIKGFGFVAILKFDTHNSLNHYILWAQRLVDKIYEDTLTPDWFFQGCLDGARSALGK